MILYDVAMQLYAGIVKAVAPYNEKARQWSRGRKDIFKRLAQSIGEEGPIAWFHCASLGEFEQGRPLIEQFREYYPQYKILVTFFSPSGYEIRKNYSGADFVFYLPIDTRRNARRFLSIVRPSIAVFVKYEFWINYLKELKRRGVKTYVVSAIFRPSQLFFRPYGGMYRKVLHLFSHIFVQDEASRQLLDGIGIQNVSVCGDTRFDRVVQIAGHARQIDCIARFAQDHRVFISGSSWEKDDEITLRLIDSYRNLRFLIAPHEITEAKILGLCHAVEQMGRTPVRYTRIQEGENADEADVMIVDTVGILSSVYQYGFCAYIGGGFGVGIHNTLEAATFGLPLIFGPNYERFNEAVQLVALGGACPIHDFSEADAWLQALVTNPEKKEKASEACFQYVRANTGAVKKILEYGLI